MQNPLSGRGVVGAFDHGSNGVVGGGEDPLEILRVLSRSNIEALLVGPGLAGHAAAMLDHVGAPKLIVALDMCIVAAIPGSDGPMTQHRQLINPLDAIRLGATAAKVLLPVGLETAAAYAESASMIARIAQECSSLGLPLIIEPALWGPAVPADTDELIAHSVRVCVELGADIVKMPAPKDPALLKKIIKWAPVPVYVLGGDPAEPRTLAEDLVSWCEAGAAGVMVGRNVWSRPSPIQAVQALQSAIHDTDVDQCVRHLKAATSYT